MTDEQKKNKQAQDAEVFMWLVFICCGMMIAFIKYHPCMPVLVQEMQGERHDRVPVLIESVGFVAALLMCFPPLHRGMLKNSAMPLTGVCKRALAAFVWVALCKGVFCI